MKVDLEQLVRDARVSNLVVNDEKGQPQVIILPLDRYNALIAQNGSPPEPAPKRKPTRGERKARQRQRIAAAKAAEEQRKRARRQGYPVVFGGLKSRWN